MAEPIDQQRRQIAALAYAVTPIVPIVVLTSEMKRDAYLRRHAAQGLVWTPGFLALLALAVIAMIWMIRTDLLLICLIPVVLNLPFLPGALWGWRVYRGGDPRPPLIAPLAERLFPAR